MKKKLSFGITFGLAGGAAYALAGLVFAHRGLLWAAASLTVWFLSSLLVTFLLMRVSNK